MHDKPMLKQRENQYKNNEDKQKGTYDTLVNGTIFLLR